MKQPRKTHRPEPKSDAFLDLLKVVGKKNKIYSLNDVLMVIYHARIRDETPRTNKHLEKELSFEHFSASLTPQKLKSFLLHFQVFFSGESLLFETY